MAVAGRAGPGGAGGVQWRGRPRPQVAAGETGCSGRAGRAGPGWVVLGGCSGSGRAGPGGAGGVQWQWQGRAGPRGAGGMQEGGWHAVRHRESGRKAAQVAHMDLAELGGAWAVLDAGACPNLLTREPRSTTALQNQPRPDPSPAALRPPHPPSHTACARNEPSTTARN